MIKLARNIGMAAALLSSSAALAQESGWTISDADGQISVIRDDKAIYGAKGTQLQVGDVVRTSRAGQAILMRGDEFVIVSANEQVRIVETEEAGAVDQVLQFLGTMLSSKNQPAKSKRPPMAAVVKGYGSALTDGEASDSDD
ncbi:MAG: hypothetical protein AAF250_06710 [Pseudomonadota bacterium]